MEARREVDSTRGGGIERERKKERERERERKSERERAWAERQRGEKERGRDRHVTGACTKRMRVAHTKTNRATMQHERSTGSTSDRTGSTVVLPLNEGTHKGDDVGQDHEDDTSLEPAAGQHVVADPSKRVRRAVPRLVLLTIIPHTCSSRINVCNGVRSLDRRTHLLIETSLLKEPWDTKTKHATGKGGVPAT